MSPCFITHPLLHCVISVFSCLTDNPQRNGGVIKVLTLGVQVLEVVLEEQPVLGQTLYGLQKEVLQLEVAALGLLLKLLDER